MNSDKAADVRNSINKLPCVAHDIETREYSSDKLESHQGGVEVTFTGEHVHLRDWLFAPATTEIAGEIAFGDTDNLRPCYEVVVPSISLPGDMHGFVPTDIVYEAAKHDCLVRVTEDGSLRLRDDMQHREEADLDTDQCDECGCTRWQLRDGVPVCDRCGNTQQPQNTRETTTQ